MPVVVSSINTPLFCSALRHLHRLIHSIVKYKYSTILQFTQAFTQTDTLIIVKYKYSTILQCTQAFTQTDTLNSEV